MAQEPVQKKRIHIGISAGIFTSEFAERAFANAVYIDPDLNLGLLQMGNFNSGNIAIPVIFDLSKKLSIQSGIGYTLRKYLTTGRYIPNDITYFHYSSLHVIELPLSFHYKIKLADKISLIPSIGYSMDIVTSPRYIYLYEAGTPYTANYDYVKMGYSERRVLNSMLLALGYETDLLKYIVYQAIINSLNDSSKIDGTISGSTDLEELLIASIILNHKAIFNIIEYFLEKINNIMIKHNNIKFELYHLNNDNIYRYLGEFYHGL
jgi:hypothetical protein